jgi:hypothetical protein
VGRRGNGGRRIWSEGDGRERKTRKDGKEGRRVGGSVGEEEQEQKKKEEGKGRKIGMEEDLREKE